MATSTVVPMPMASLSRSAGPGASTRQRMRTAVHVSGINNPRRAAVATKAALTNLTSRPPVRLGSAQRSPSRSARSPSRRAAVRNVPLAIKASATPKGPNTTAADAVNNGLKCFEMRKYEDAVANFTSALTDFGAPSEDESRAALYNRACAHCKLQNWDDARDDLRCAVNDFELKFSVVLKDGDMEVFRGTRQYEEMADSVKGFRSNTSIANLKAEAQEPFRFFKLYAFGGLGVGAFIGLIIILSRLSLAIAGGEDAPDLGETIGNLAINALAISVFGFLFKGELAQRDLTQKKVAREEEFGRLRISVANDGEDVLVSQLRGNYRLFLVTGSPEHVDTVTAGLAKYKTLLKEKNVIIATLDMTGDGANRVVVAESEKQEPGAAVAALAAEFAAARVASDAELSAPTVMEFGNKSKKTKSTAPRRKPGGTSTPTEKKWRVAPVDVDTWRAWVVNEIERVGFDKSVRDVFFSVGKDGTLWKSGAGTPNWMKLIEELPDDGWTGGV